MKNYKLERSFINAMRIMASEIVSDSNADYASKLISMTNLLISVLNYFEQDIMIEESMEAKKV